MAMNAMNYNRPRPGDVLTEYDAIYDAMVTRVWDGNRYVTMGRTTAIGNTTMNPNALTSSQYDWAYAQQAGGGGGGGNYLQPLAGLGGSVWPNGGTVTVPYEQTFTPAPVTPEPAAPARSWQEVRFSGLMLEEV